MAEPPRQDDLEQITQLDYHLRGRLEHFLHQDKQYGNCTDVLIKLQDAYIETIINGYRARGAYDKQLEALKWFGKANGWMP